MRPWKPYVTTRRDSDLRRVIADIIPEDSSDCTRVIVVIPISSSFLGAKNTRLRRLSSSSTSIDRRARVEQKSTMLEGIFHDAAVYVT